MGRVLLEQPCCLIHHHWHLDGRQCCSNVLFLLGGNQSSGSLIEGRNNLDICRYRCTGSRLAFFLKSLCDSQSITPYSLSLDYFTTSLCTYRQIMTTKKTTNLVQIITMMENEWQLSEDEIEEDLLDEECSLPTDYLQKAQGE